MNAIRFLGCVVLIAGCGRAPTPSTTPTSTHSTVGLHNVRTINEKLLSGSSPDGPPGFATLKALGVRTIISVDGATPDLAEAEKHGLRYVHLPVGYDGIPRERALQLAKAVRDMPGLVYVHCHHGKHRGPAACAAIQLLLDPNFSLEQAEQLMKEAGTDPKYTGLIGLPKHLKRATPDELDRIPANFPAVAPVADLTRRMVAVDETWDRLKLAQAAAWKVPADHPDLDPAHEAVQLTEHYRESARLSEAKTMPFAEAETIARDLERALRTRDTTASNAAFTRAAKSCTTCHAQHRDQPRK